MNIGGASNDAGRNRIAIVGSRLIKIEGGAALTGKVALLKA